MGMAVMIVIITATILIILIIIVIITIIAITAGFMTVIVAVVAGCRLPFIHQGDFHWREGRFSKDLTV